MPSEWLYDHVSGCVLGGAIGDALGAPLEGRQPEEIPQRFGNWVSDFAPPYDPKLSDGRYKGDARVTDDTLMVVAFSQVYLTVRRHVTAYDAVQLADLMVKPDTYVPEFGKRMKLIDRLFYPEKWLFQRLSLAGADPREGGIGNAVNCGCAMYISPVGMINAGNPQAAYAEAIDWGAAHTQSYGREAAGVMAAAVAEALRPGATWRSVVDVAYAVARDGTRVAIEALQQVAAALPADGDPLERAHALRAAMVPFDTVGHAMKDYTQPGRYPSRSHSIEEVPLALAYLTWAQGDYTRAVLGAINYGRDCDSIAGMVGALSGALSGKSELPARWVETVEEVNHLELDRCAHQLSDLAAEIHARDWQAASAHHELLGSHLNG